MIIISELEIENLFVIGLLVTLRAQRCCGSLVWSYHVDNAFFCLTRLSALCLALIAAPVFAQPPEAEADLVLPESPNGYPMETVWDAAPGTVNGQITETGPYRVSRWGDIVIRGRPEGGQIVSALSFIQCGKNRNSATQVVMIGEAPDDLCGSVKPVRPGKIQIVSGNDYRLYGKATGWTVVTFVQKVDGWANVSGMPPAEQNGKGHWGVNKLGALFHDENGKHVFYAPGETVDLGHGIKFVVKPVMQEDELEAYVITAAMRGFSDLPKDFGRPEADKKSDHRCGSWSCSFVRRLLFLGASAMVSCGSYVAGERSGKKYLRPK